MSEEKQSTKGILSWIREFLGIHEKELSEMESPPSDELVAKLIDKALTGKLDPSDQSDQSDPSDQSDQSDPSDNPDKTCSYALKRNIVASLQAIRDFAKKNNIGEKMLRAILTFLGEMAVGTLKGKVGEKTLEAILKALTFQQYADEAYLRGRNERIEIEYFPKAEDIPHLGGMIRDIPDDNNIFSLARKA